MKRLVFCFDGTWSRLDAPNPTNVVLTAESIRPSAEGVTQVIYYDEGVGTDPDEALAGGMFGAGLLRNLSDAYRFLVFNYEAGDEIYAFGFSRGAYTARSLIGLIATAGIVARYHADQANNAVENYRQREATDAFRERMLAFRVDYCPEWCLSEEERKWREWTRGPSPQPLPLINVRYLGVWDTVGALGIPRYLVFSHELNRMHEFHDVSLSALVQSARHAVALDERKQDFSPTLWDNLDALNRMRGADPTSPDAPYQQVWFPGAHSSVGGGGQTRGLSDLALQWVWEGAERAGLAFDRSPNSPAGKVKGDHRDVLVPKTAMGSGMFGLLLEKLPVVDRAPGPSALHEVSSAARLRWRESPDNLPERQPYRPAPLRSVAEQLEAVLKEEPAEPPDSLNPRREPNSGQ